MAVWIDYKWRWTHLWWESNRLGLQISEDQLVGEARDDTMLPSISSLVFFFFLSTQNALRHKGFKLAGIFQAESDVRSI